MNKMITKRSIAIAIAGATAIGVASPSWAAPVLSNTATVATAVPKAATDVRYYRNGYHRGYRNNGGAIIGGLALGIIETFGAAYISVPYKDGFAFLVLVAFLVFRPQGIFGERVAEKA